MKGISTSIVAAIIVVAVVAVAGYNYYLQKPSTPSTQGTALTDCQRKLLSYCVSWDSNNYTRAAATAGGNPGSWNTFASGCSRLNVTPTVDACKRLAGASPNPTTGRIVQTGKDFLDSCNPRIDTCAAGLVCKLGRDNTYRCLRTS